MDIDGQRRRFFGAGNCPNNPTCSLMGLLQLRCVPSTVALCCRANLPKIFVGEFFWEGIDAMGVQSKIVDGERPRQPEGEKECTLTVELWGVFAKCWGVEPESRISVSDVLQYL
jgi:hypothetical protein